MQADQALQYNWCAACMAKLGTKHGHGLHLAVADIRNMDLSAWHRHAPTEKPVPKTVMHTDTTSYLHGVESGGSGRLACKSRACQDCNADLPGTVARWPPILLQVDCLWLH